MMRIWNGYLMIDFKILNKLVKVALPIFFLQLGWMENQILMKSIKNVLNQLQSHLKNYLQSNFSNLKLNENLSFLQNIAYNLETIHDENYIHKDLHSGNILQFNNNNKYGNTKITDLGLAQLINNSKSPDSSNVCGV